MTLTEEQIAAWEQLARDISHPAKASEWAFQLRDAVLAMATRLRSLLAPSPADTVRLLYPDGTHRDVEAEEPCASNEADINDTSFTVEEYRGRRVFTRFGWSKVEPRWAELRRERTARLETERQRDEAQGKVDRLEDELERVRFLSQEVEREFNPLNCVDVGLLIERLKRERDEALAKNARLEAERASPAPASAPLRERLGRLALDTMRAAADELHGITWCELGDRPQNAFCRIGNAVQADTEARIAASLRQSAERIRGCGASPEQSALRYQVADEIERGEHREPKEME